MLAFPAYKHLPVGYVPIVLGVCLGCLLTSAPIRDRLNTLLLRSPSMWFAAGLVIVGLLLRLLALAIAPVEPVSDHAIYHYSAVSLANGEGYGHTAFNPPGMSLLLAAWYRLTVPLPTVGKLLNIGFGLATVLALLDFGVTAVSESAGRWAALLAAIMPTLVIYSAGLGYEIVLGFILLAVADLNLRIDRAFRTWPFALAMGLLLGFGSLVKPICLLIPLLLCLHWWLAGFRQIAIARGSIVLLAMTSVIAPWTLRNWRVLGSPVIISTNGGVVLYSANNPLSDGLFTRDPLFQSVGEIKADQIRRRQAIDWIRNNPGEWARLAVKKTVYVWGTSSSIMSFISSDRMKPGIEALCKAVINVSWAALFVLATVGIARSNVCHNPRLYFSFMLVGYVFVIQLFSEALSRHHIPILWVLLLVAAAGLGRRTAVP